jgi:hypothetical protein
MLPQAISEPLEVDHPAANRANERTRQIGLVHLRDGRV